VAGALIALALLAALGAVAARALRARAAHRTRAQALAARPGFSRENPLRIASFDEIDHAVDTWRCPCGGLLDRIGEGGRERLRVVRCTCLVCEEDLDLFFDLTELRN
jgi:hypothetical protein